MSTNAFETEHFKAWTGADKASFEEHASKVHKLSTKPSNEDLLELYGYFKQTTVGDNTTARPGGILQFADKYKWDAWMKHKGLSQDEAAKKYIAVAARLIAADAK